MTNQRKILPVSSLMYALFISIICVATSCARKISFLQSPIVPAADGFVKVKTDKNKNYVLRIQVRHLAEPQKLPIPSNTYVVWLETPGHQYKNLGQLKSAGNFLKPALNASLETVTTFELSRIFITAENEAAISYPRGREILTTNF